MSVTDERHRALGLTDDEYALIVSLLDRPPGDTELAMLSLMWSEHCAYKHSKKLLRRLPTDGPAVLMGPGENAGVVDVGGGLGVAFKVESHNHPSAVEPFQGAATGVGGILRDIFAVGARPIAVLDSLRFGEPARSQRSRYLLERAVAGIGHYGNSIGVPTVGGEIYFEDPYEHNCLINAMCLGLAPHERLIRAAAAGPGNVLVLLGALTGRDGIGGASVLASAELGESDEAKRPSVQIGDPFAEKKLLECSLELLDSRAAGVAAGPRRRRADLVGLRDGGQGRRRPRHRLRPGAAARAGPGAVRDHGVRVPGADAVRRGPRARRRGDRGLRALGDPRHPDRRGDRLRADADPRRPARSSADLPVSILVDDCPLYDLQPAAPDPGGAPLYPAPASVLTGGESAGETLLALLSSSNIVSRRPVFEQYDPVVQSRTVRRPEQADAAVLALPTGEAIAVAIDGNGRRVACDPRAGAIEVVFECAANLACVGAAAAGADQLPELRQPGEAPRRLAADRSGRRARARLRRARDPGDRRQRLALQRGTERADLPDPGDRHGRCAARPDSRRRPRLHARRRRDRAGRRVRARLRRLGAGQAAGRTGERAAAVAGRGRGGAGARAGPLAGALRRGAQRPRHRRGRDRGGAGRVLRGRIGWARGSTLPAGLDPFAEALGVAFIVSGAPEALAGLDVIGTVGGDSLSLDGIAELAVSEIVAARERRLEQPLLG